MKFRYLLTVASVAFVAVQPSAFALDCGPSGCGPASGAPVSGAPGCGTCFSGNCQSGCPTCNSQEMCCPCCDIWSEGIDVDSLTLEARSKRLYEAQQARLEFELPEDAFVYLSGQRMSACGAERTFIVPVLHSTKVFKYDIKIDVVRGGKKYFKKSKIEILRAGAILSVKVEAPPVADGEPATIKVEVAPIAPGGPPAEDADNADDASGETENVTVSGADEAAVLQATTAE